MMYKYEERLHLRGSKSPTMNSSSTMLPYPSLSGEGQKKVRHRRTDNYLGLAVARFLTGRVAFRRRSANITSDSRLYTLFTRSCLSRVGDGVKQAS
jgi:hypothetical protein